MLFIVILSVASCGRIDFENLDALTDDGDTAFNPESEATVDTAREDNLFYAGPTLAVPIAAPNGERFISGDSNSLGIQGRWYSYTDDVSTTTMSNAVNGFFYLSGELAPGAPERYMYVGMGMGLCFDPNAASSAASNAAYYPIGNCPWAPDLANLVVGFAFELDGTYPESGGLVLIFMSNSTGNSLHWEIPSTGRHEVRFSDMRIAQPGDPFTAGDIDRVQFQLGNQTGTSAPYDFFAGNFEILIRAQ